MIELRTTLRASKIPAIAYHLFPIVGAFLTMFYFHYIGCLGMGIDGICGIMTDYSFNSSLAVLIIFLGVPSYTLIYIKKKVPNNERIGPKVKRFIEYYTIYVYALIFIYFGISVAGFMEYVGIENYIKNYNDTELLVVAAYIKLILLIANPIILTAIRINDPTIRKNWDVIFPCLVREDSIQYDKSLDDEDNGGSKQPLILNLLKPYQPGEENMPTEEEKKVLKRRDSMPGDVFEATLENTSVLKQIKHSLKVQVIYSILSAINYFWEMESRKEKSTTPQVTYKDAAKVKKTICITEDIL